jgi:hypothetical protein
MFFQKLLAKKAYGNTANARDYCPSTGSHGRKQGQQERHIASG